MPGDVRIDHGVTSGTFSLDGQTWNVDNNVWVFGDDAECVVFDAPHDAEAIAELIGDRTLRAVLCTHAHDDHIGAARTVAERYMSPVRLHPADAPLWRMTYPRFDFVPLADGEELTVADERLQVRHAPGHSPGGVCFYCADQDVVFSGDTLFHGGPGATGRSFSDFGTIIESIRARLLSLPPGTVVHTGHGEDTTIGAEAEHIDEWIARGH